ncbi:MAG: hypothetical protein M0Z55_02995 [Peptococcaceae bacterium]|nr:hypothetical protein [Peptococcaceae bacterium]
MVTRKSHNNDLVFRVIEIKPDSSVELKGLTVRLHADAPLQDLNRVISPRVEGLAQARERLISLSQRSGKVAMPLHARWQRHAERDIPPCT